MPHEEPVISRIRVDREAEWVKIRGNVERSMAEDMEARLGTLPGGPSGAAARAVRKEVEARLSRIREEMFSLAKPNIRMSGQPYETFIEATEPWDEVLDHRMWSIAVEKDSWSDQVAVMRKTVPGQVQNANKDMERRQTDAEWIPEGEDDEPDHPKAALPPPPRQDEVKATLDTVLSTVSDLVQTAPAQLQRAQRAQSVRDEVASMPK